MKSGCYRITKELLNTHSTNSKQDNIFLNLPNIGLQSIDRLQQFCPNLQVLFLHGNLIQEINTNFLQLRNIWILDISQNKLQSLDGLEQFIVLGSVNLSRNNISWKELRKISHVTFLCLYLFKNHQLDQDPQYREHVIDLFSKVWFLDGILITAEERKHIDVFFELESHKLVNPVRRKSSRNPNFIPTIQRNFLTNELYGVWTERFMKQFPLNFIQDSFLDSRRISFLFNSLLECYRLTPVANFNDNFEFLDGLSFLIDARKKFPENCNMLLLFIVVYILFSLPKVLIVECLVKTDLESIHELNCTQLFLTASYQLLNFIASVLLASLLVDRENGIRCGLYEKLFDAIYLCVYEIFTEKSSITFQNSNYCLLASEVLEPFCLIQNFFELIGEDEGVSKLVVFATRDPFILKEINEIKLSSTGDKWVKYQEISALLLHKSVPNLIYSTLETSYFSSSDSDNRVFPIPDIHDQSKVENHLWDELNEEFTSDFSNIYQQNASIVRPGDFVRLHNNKLARVLTITAPDLALLSATSQSVTEFIYVKTTKLAWDPIGRWIVKEKMKSQLNTTSNSSSPSTTTFYISRPSSNCESSNYDIPEISDNQLSDSLHCNSLINTDEPTNLQVNYKDVMSSQQSLEELKQERKYIQHVINQMHHELCREFHNVYQHGEKAQLNTRFVNAQRSFDNLFIDNSKTLPSMCYGVIKRRSKSCSTQRSQSEFSKTCRLSSQNYIFQNNSGRTPQSWIEVANTKDITSPSICNLAIHIDPKKAKSFTKWSPSSSFCRLSYKSKKRSHNQKVAMKSEPLLCVVGNNVALGTDVIKVHSQSSSI